jgi:hypothetical protein
LAGAPTALDFVGAELAAAGGGGEAAAAALGLGLGGGGATTAAPPGFDLPAAAAAGGEAAVAAEPDASTSAFSISASMMSATGSGGVAGMMKEDAAIESVLPPWLRTKSGPRAAP